jgi:5-methylthioadenosine/S-adenosylhomocysteine deaminase
MTKTLVRGGCVLTMGRTNHAHADVLIDGERIVEVGPGLRARDAEVVDASNAIVMPGFVDTHRHAWASLLRNLGVSTEADTYGPSHGPDDIYAATLVGLLGAVDAGISTVVDWCDPAFDARRLEAAVQAHADAGIRGVLVHGQAPWVEGDLRAGLRRAADGRFGPLLTAAAGSRDLDPAAVESVAAEWDAAREHGLRIHVHAGTAPSGAGVVAELAGRGLLRADVTLVHCTHLDDADLDAVASAGASVSSTPSAEMAEGVGSPPIQALVDRGIRPGLGVDSERTAPGDLFAQMRTTISVQHATVFDLKLAGKAGVPRLLTTRQVIRYATVDGARAAGLGGGLGTLEPGAPADVVVLRSDRPNVHPVNDPIGAVVWGMDTSNVEWVFVAGRALKRNGALDTDVGKVRRLALDAHRRVADASGIPVAAGGMR